jgi:alkaline phosphatase D
MVDRRNFIKNTALTASAILSSTFSTACGEGGLEFSEVNKPAVKPFLHGVASGDPLHDRVIIWSRVTPEKEEAVEVRWQLSNEQSFEKVLQSGVITTGPDTDYTLKIDVENLAPSTTYYYQFIFDNKKSGIGITKTTAQTSDKKIKLAVVSCSDYSAGYYNALARIAERKDLDAVVHLGDYIYEGLARMFDPNATIPIDHFEDVYFNRNKQWWLRFYRVRYATNRLDADLQAAHQAHPFITIWDDHEIGNNTWKDGAQGHDPEKDGPWEIRKNAAKQAYAEWLPIRGDASKIYRSIRFGNMAELILLDTRLEGRDQQIYSAEHPDLFAAQRTLLGKEQKQWLLQKLDASPCQWKIVANQVIFSEVNVQWANFAGRFTQQIQYLQGALLDYWEGYPAERDEVINHIAKNKLNDVVILSASMHCALAFDVTSRATKNSRKGESATYDGATGKGSVAVEFAAPSITSDNFDEKMGKLYAGTFESLINRKLPHPLNYNPNPHMKFVDLQRHGYTILTLSRDRAEANFYFVNDLGTRTSKETLGASWHTKTGKNRLEKS